MVKADPKHDYYADLELPSTADSETIKKQFRLLAKQYHPDRNPGKEIDVIPKFQAIQAANEILGDPNQKKRYDAERAVMSKPGESATTYASSYKKPGKPPPPASPFPPPPKRDPNLNRPFNSRPRPSSTAERFAPFTKPGNQQWDRAKFEDAAKAETLYNLNKMRPHSQGPPPRVPPRAPPTAPKPPSGAPSPDTPQAPGPSPGFPGLSRTNSGRRGGFATGATGKDEPPAPSSAYAHVHRSDRPPSAAAGYSYPSNTAGAGLSNSPPMQRTRPSMSPLRTSKSSGFEDVQRPQLHRSSSRYATNTGERTDINGPGLTRSASVRNSPTGHRWDDSVPFTGRPQSQQQGGFKVPPPRHHSSSPRGRAANANFDWSASETSSSEDEPPKNDARKKATPRKPVNPPTSHRTFSDNDPALTGQFPNSNYKTTNIHEGRYYPYPVPDSKGTPSNPVDDITQGLNDAGIRHVHKDEVPFKNQSSHYTSGISSEPQSAAAKTNGVFSAADWQDKFRDDDNAFRPQESKSRSRSPTKQNKPRLPNRNRGPSRNETEKPDIDDTNNDTTNAMPGVRHVAGTGNGLGKAAAFEPAKFSAEDWAERLRKEHPTKPAPKVPSREQAVPSQNTAKQPVVHPEVEVVEDTSSSNRPQAATVGPDAMDVDESAPQQTPSVSNGSIPRKPVNSTTRRPSSSGVNLSEFKETAPFKPNANGLNGLGDLGDTLPFQSRAAAELNLHQAPSSGAAARHLNLPPPPKPVLPPDGDYLTQESWTRYSEKMIHYMDAWNIFNCKMIDHFRTRQEQISLAMYHNWITAVGDGASADRFNGLDFVGTDQVQEHQGDGQSSAKAKSKKAGYATYMEWLEQDRVCRSWWDVAFDEHAQCMEDLGRVRKMVKSIRAKELGQTSQ